MKPIKLLMIEDNQGDVVLLQAAVEKLGLAYEVTVVTDGIEAVEYLYQRGKHALARHPDLILLDLKLPKKNGREVLAEIWLAPALRAIPLILLSSSQSELELAKEYGLPSECYVEKPSTYLGFLDLVTTIERVRRNSLPESIQGDS